MITSAVRRLRARIRAWVVRRSPQQVLVAGYVLLSLVGFLLLLSPWTHATSVPWPDLLFTAVSAVSTTGLVTVPTGESYTMLGQALTLVLFQAGGLGYMSVGSFILLQRSAPPTPEERELAAADFGVPEDFDLRAFARAVVGFTVLAEGAGTAALYVVFLLEGVENPLWMALYHAVSAFCTAGFTLFSGSFEAFSLNGWITGIVVALSLVGATGFLVVTDLVRRARGRTDALSFTTRLILRALALFLPAATAVVFLFEPAFGAAGWWDRLLLSFFQASTAITTVGFSTFPVGQLSPAILTFLLVVMIVGLAPGGTGGGVKITTVVTLLAVMRSRLRGRVRIELMDRRVSSERITLAATLLFSHVLFIGIVVFVFMILESHAFQDVVFEVTSAMGTVGLSTGITPDLSAAGKALIIVTMIVGRLRTLTFGLALLGAVDGGPEREREAEEEEERAREEEREAEEEQADEDRQRESAAVADGDREAAAEAKTGGRQGERAGDTASDDAPEEPVGDDADGASHREAPADPSVAPDDGERDPDEPGRVRPGETDEDTPEEARRDASDESGEDRPDEADKGEPEEADEDELAM